MLALVKVKIWGRAASNHSSHLQESPVTVYEILYNFLQYGIFIVGIYCYWNTLLNKKWGFALLEYFRFIPISDFVRLQLRGK